MLIEARDLEKAYVTRDRLTRSSAVDSATFSVGKGECVGLIGRNGSGKTTLLKVLAGIVEPSSGSLEVRGELATLIEPGSGLELDATGRENLRNLYLLQGVDKERTAMLVERASAFSDLGPYLDQPLRTYSAGMVMRIAFAGVIFLPVELLLVDEVLSVGDPVFQRKCANEIRRFVGSGGTLVLASHNYHEVAALCERVIFLDSGRIIADGPADVVFRSFWERNEQDLMRITTAGELPQELIKAHAPLAENTGEARIESVRFLDQSGADTSEIVALAPLTIEILYQARQPIASPLCRVQFHRADGLFVMGSNTDRHEFDLGAISGPGVLRLVYESFPLAQGDYLVSVGLWPDEYRSFIAERAYDFHENRYVLRVVQPRSYGGGLVASRHAWCHER